MERDCARKGKEGGKGVGGATLPPTNMERDCPEGGEGGFWNTTGVSVEHAGECDGKWPFSERETERIHTHFGGPQF